MVMPGGEEHVKVIADLISSIITNRKVPKYWESYIINLYKGIGAAFCRGNYRGLKLLEHVMKVLARIAEKQIRSIIKIHEMHFGFMQEHGTTDAIFIL